ncbi:hypothetical protein [Candidatus Uabimicrobium sp. HlEnr_7]|uniref:hypothetical protein n=1 Tax=Candidatus Uabimicrobium helgolandensis TaxID=3095367 RepID=UPI003558F13D
MDFDVEDYQRRQEVRRKKDVAIRRKKTRNQIIGASIIFTILALILSVTEMGCDFLQNYIDDQVKPYIEQAKKIDSLPQGSIFYPEDSKTFNGLMEKNFKGSWLIGIQDYVCDMNLFWSRSYKAYRSYNKYRIYFGTFFPEKIPEFMFTEISMSKDSGQFKTCGELIEYFYYKYGNKLKEVEPWSTKIQDVEVHWKQINASKRLTNEFVY